MMNSTIFQFTKIFFIVNLCLIFYALVFEDYFWLLNTQVAFLGSLLITIASFLSYKKNIQSRLSNLDISSGELITEERDKIDEIDDPYDLYSEYKEIPEEELTKEKIKEIIQGEKNKVKRNSFKNTIFSIGGFVSIYRILGYGCLVFGFLALSNNKLFIVIPFFIGLTVVPIGTLISRFILKSEEDQ